MTAKPPTLSLQTESGTRIHWAGRFGTGLAVWVVCLLLADLPVARWCSRHELPRELRELLAAAEYFGTPHGQLLILLTLFVAFAGREARLGRIWWGTCAAGLGANVIKLLLARTRPRAFDFDSTSILASFQDWLPLGAGGTLAQSFPSAHSASAFGFAVLLVWAWPQGRWAFYSLACLTAAQRVTCGAHFPSDTILGGLLGWSLASLFIHWQPLSQVWSRWEERWRKSMGQNHVRTEHTEVRERAA